MPQIKEIDKQFICDDFDPRSEWEESKPDRFRERRRMSAPPLRMGRPPRPLNRPTDALKHLWKIIEHVVRKFPAKSGGHPACLAGDFARLVATAAAAHPCEWPS